MAVLTFGLSVAVYRLLYDRTEDQSKRDIVSAHTVIESRNPYQPPGKR